MAAPFCRCPLMAVCACVRPVCLCLCIAHTIARTYLAPHRPTPREPRPMCLVFSLSRLHVWCVSLYYICI